MRYSSRYLDHSDYSDIQIAINKCSDVFKNIIKTPEDILDSFPDKIISQDKFLVGLFDPDEKIIGLINIIKDFPNEYSWFIDIFVLSSENRNQGLGKVIFDDIEEWVLDLNAKSFIIDISKSINSKSFFKTLGFREHDPDNTFILKKIFEPFF
ncbi:MAG: GNAT family N-acetyltransferase [Candidatus Sericytochromatia bacterium]